MTLTDFVGQEVRIRTVGSHRPLVGVLRNFRVDHATGGPTVLELDDAVVPWHAVVSISEYVELDGPF